MDAGAAQGSATTLTLEDLIAIQPHHLRGPFEIGNRMPVGERIGRGWADSLDFDGVSPYAPGDDPRRVDWRATARTGTAQVKRFLAQSYRARLIIADLRPQVFFGTSERLLAKTIALVAARLAWEAVLLNEPVGLVVPGLVSITPRRGRRHVLRMLDHLQVAYAGGGGDAPDLATSVLEAAGAARRGDEVCVVSDFGDPLGAFTSRTTALTEQRAMRAIVAEDPLGRTGLAAGAYPSRLLAAGARRTFTVARRDTASGVQRASLLRAKRRRQFLDAGWTIALAADILPRLRPDAQR